MASWSEYMTLSHLKKTRPRCLEPITTLPVSAGVRGAGPPSGSDRRDAVFFVEADGQAVSIAVPDHPALDLDPRLILLDLFEPIQLQDQVQTHTGTLGKGVQAFDIGPPGADVPGQGLDHLRGLFFFGVDFYLGRQLQIETLVFSSLEHSILPIVSDYAVDVFRFSSYAYGHRLFLF